MEFREVVKLLKYECKKHAGNGCVDCTLSGEYICADILKMKNLSDTNIEKIEKICAKIHKKNNEKEVKKI